MNDLSPRPFYEHVAIAPATLRAWGRRAACAIEAPTPGVFRVRVAPVAIATAAAFPDLPEKRSFARVAPAAPPSALAIDRDDAGCVLRSGDHAATLRVALDGGGWLLRDDDGRPLARALAYDGDATPGFPLDRRLSRLTLVAPEGEAYFGFGEKVGPLDKRGMRFSFWNTDAFPPQPHTDPLYVSIPFFVAIDPRDGRAWGMFVDETTRARVDVAAEDTDRLVWEVEGPEIDVYLLTGPTPADVIRRYVALTGRPFVPPLFALGAQQSRWGYATSAQARDVVRGLRAHDLPLDVLYLDIDHMDAFKTFTWSPTRYADPASLTRELREEGVRVVTIVDPALRVDDTYAPYVEARAKGHLVELERGGPLVGEVWPDPAVWPDLTRDEVQRFWADLHARLVEVGVAGVWNDMNEPSCFSIAETRGLPAPTIAGGSRVPGASAPLGSTLPDEAWHGERRHIEVHNAYALGMARAAWDGLARHAPSRRPFVLTRAAFAGIQRYAAIWTGDFTSHWTHLDATIPMLLGLGMSGVPFVGSDVPGFLGDASGELCVRWTQAAAFAPLHRNHSSRGTRPKEPWRFGEPWLAHVRAALALRYRMLPALYTAMIEAHETGMPALRPLVIDHPADRDAHVTCDEAILAGAVLVAPITRPGQTKRMVYLPRGRWAPLAMDLASAPPIDGPAHVVADGPIDRLPMFLAEGTGFAATEPALFTTTAEWAALTWHLFPAEDGAVDARLYEDEGDGPAAEAPSGTWTRISGAPTPGGVRLTRHVSGRRPHRRRVRERVVLHGDGAPRVVDVAPGWTTLDVPRG